MHVLITPCARQILQHIKRGGQVLSVTCITTTINARRRVNDFFPDEARDLLKKRFAIIQTWRSIGFSRVSRTPHFVYANYSRNRFIRNERRYRDRTAETYHISYNPAHELYYFPHMTNDELLIFKVFDTTKRRCTFHCSHSFFGSNTNANAPARQSIEMSVGIF